MRVPKFLQAPLIKLLLPSIRLIIVIATCDITLLIILYSTLKHEHGQFQDQRLFLFLLILVGYILLFYQFNRNLLKSVQQYIAQLRLNLMDRLRKADVYAFEQIGAETMYTALTLDMNLITQAAHLITIAVWAISVIIGGFVYIAILSWQAFGLAAIVLGIGGIVYLYDQVEVNRAIKQAREQEKYTLGALTDLLDGFKELRINPARNEDFFQRGLKPYVAELQTINLKAHRHLMNTDTVVYTLWQGLMILLIFFLPVLGITSRYILLGSVGIVLYLPIDTLMEEIPELIQANASLRRLYALEQRLEALVPEDWEFAAQFEHEPFHQLHYEQIRFAYDAQEGQPFTVGPLSLTVVPQEIVFITGGNGSGKTTCLKLLTGLYPASEGQLLLNGKAISPQQHRYLFTPIFSDFHLFDRLYGLAEVDAQKLQTLLVRMQLEQKLQFRDGRFSTLDLSTGQKKRLALVVAMMEDRPIYVLDEWAAEQDPDFRRYFYETLLPEFKARGKTVILVTHDERYFHVADRIIKMEDGEIIEEYRRPVL
jgi:putative pyoverdin transport system ATP-binding/permease protein